MLTQNNRLIIILFSTLFLLLIPLVAMQFTDEVNWSPADFMVMGVLLIGTGSVCDLVLIKVKKVEQRILLFIFVIAVFLIIWAELAVGIIGTPFAGS